MSRSQRAFAVTVLDLGDAAEIAIRTGEWALLVPMRVPEGDPPRADALREPDDRWEVNDLRSRNIERRRTGSETPRRSEEKKPQISTDNTDSQKERKQLSSSLICVSVVILALYHTFTTTLPKCEPLSRCRNAAGGFYQREDAVDHRTQSLLRDSRVHRLEHLARADENALQPHRFIRSGSGLKLPPPGQHTDQRDVPAGLHRLQRPASVPAPPTSTT